ncbi:uncharacterized protein LOC109856415 [Pseudomyrmex gracilis]|uniref:uncharacterized protein LOC109856415 n=1 Tax=Pseudomyrmex gracilis TaxID=219809 RepID=UPI000995B78C|nr:uncharacterized protein LOC109856415 [Pseudomyrmex gracilis]
MSTLGISCYEDGFRLGGPPSECSLKSKAQIDALFEDSRSICSSTLGGWYAGLSNATNPDDVGAEEQKRVNSAVQARIEAMFASVEAESGTPGECAAAILPVKYMGAAPVGGRVASVRGLQEPLRQLLERIEVCVRAELEVSRRGLTFRTSEICEKNNPFRRIAVWSALRLRCKRTPSGDVHHAFLPLVGDQDQGQTLEDKHADLYRTMRGLRSEAECYPPIFAVVMRRPGAAKVLECHAFACESEEDAVAAAATLYRALLADLDANRRRPRHANGLGCVSLASVVSSAREQPSLGRRIGCLLPPPPRPTAPHPVRPPRMKKSSVSSSVTEDESAKPSLQKVPRRKKKNSDVKAEDILEARGRKRDNVVKGEKQSNSGQLKRDVVLLRNEELQNSKNKMFSVEENESHASRIEIESNKSEKIYDARDASALYERQSNKYEKLYKSNNNPKDCSQNDIYERNYGSYDLNRASGNAPAERQSYSPRAESVLMYDKVNKIGRNEIGTAYEPIGRKKDIVYGSRIEDADKIESIGNEDVYAVKNNRGQTRNRQEDDIFFAKNSRQEHSDSTGDQQKRSRNPEKIHHSGKRVSRMVTMDKPLKKDQSDPYSLNVPEYSRPRVRRRSRAGSEPPVSHSDKTNKILHENALKRSQSDIDVDKGDLMTRVELPRRGSFLTAGSGRRPNNINGGTPLGFTELFDEFRNQEGLTSVDDILAAIIDPEGMSFNDLKPLYKEFLLKLAATLTQDELYQRSASIMRRRRRPQRRRSSRRTCLLGRAIKRSVSRLKGGPTEFTSVIFPARRLNDSFGSSSSCDVRNNHRNRVLASRLGRRKSSWRIASKSGVCHTTSEDSDTCRRLSRSVGATANRSSSGYVSCSECSYDSESCTCVSADKCYCSLSRRMPADTSAPGNAIICACDTDSCSESNKCYCARKPTQPSILEQLRQKGIVPSESTLSRGDSPGERIRGSKVTGSHSSSRNIDFHKKRSSAVCGSSDNLALDYDLFSPGRRSQQSSGSEKVLVVSARDTQGRLVYVGGAERDKKHSSRGSGRSGAHHEALSIKKSAEIAAVFGDSNRISRRTSNASSVKSSVSLEAGLGYLP